MADVMRHIGSDLSMDDGFCGLDPRAWIRFSRGSVKESDIDDQRTRGADVNLFYFEELRTLSQTNFKLTLHPTAESSKTNSSKTNSSSSSTGAFAGESKKPKRTYWVRPPLPHLASFRCVAGSVPKIRVRTTADGVSGSKRNPVFRSNSFRYEKYSKDDSSLDTVSEKSVLHMPKIVSVSEEYHTPKDLINRIPLCETVVDTRGFDHGTRERPRSAMDLRPINLERGQLFLDSRTRLSDTGSEDYLVEVPYTDPKDSKLYTQPGIDPSDDQIYKVYVGSETLYCRPYQHLKRGTKLPGQTHILRNPAKIPYREIWSSTYEDVKLGQDCVTIIPVSVSGRPHVGTNGSGKFATPPSSPSPTNDSGATPTTMGSETSSDHGSFIVPSPYYLQSNSGDISGPFYENMEFHRVNIQHPPVGSKGESGVMLRRHRNRVTDKKSAIFVRSSQQKETQILDNNALDQPSYTRPQLNQAVHRKFVKFGYSQHEVWNWLHREDVNANAIIAGDEISRNGIGQNDDEANRVCGGCKTSNGRKTFEVKFSAFEFLAASSRLSSLNLEGLESFVATMLEKAISGRKKVIDTAKLKKIEEKSSHFCTIRNQQQKMEPQNINNNYRVDEVLLFGQSESGRVSCPECSQNNKESYCQIQQSSHQSDSTSHPYQVLPSHNYQSLYQVGSSSHQKWSSSKNVVKAYTTLEALNQDIRGYSDSLYRPLSCTPVAQIDTALPLERQEWYHGSISRIGAENLLRLHEEGSFLVRNSESSSQDYSLSVKSSRGFMHMRIQEKMTTDGATYILGQFSKPFRSVSLMVQYYTENRLPIKGAEHTYLRYPVCEELL